jgi:large subunit ribosomal protein L30
MTKLRITQVRSAADKVAKQRGTLRALGLRGIGRPVVREDKPEIRGMITTVRHLIEVEETNG